MMDVFASEKGARLKAVREAVDKVVNHVLGDTVNGFLDVGAHFFNICLVFVKYWGEVAHFVLDIGPKVLNGVEVGAFGGQSRTGIW
jgi:hypothetical protein